MSKPYRIHVDHDGWRWIGTPDQPTGFVALPHTSMHAAHRIVEELNGLLNAHDKQKDRAEKAEARVAELEREVAAWSPARHYGEEDDVYDPKPIWHTLADGTRIPRCPTHGYDFATEEWGASSPPVLLRVTCQRCSWASGPIERAAPPQCPTGASGGDHGPEGGEGAQTPGPVLGHPRGSEDRAAEEVRTGTWQGLTAMEYPPFAFVHEPHGPEKLCPMCNNADPRIKFRRANEVPPRAGLPSRDEVAAFLEARWPGGWRVNVRDVRIYK